MADRDVLFAVRNNFYIGAYNNAINEASDMEGLSEAEQTERDIYVYRSYIALGSHDVSGLRLQTVSTVLRRLNDACRVSYFSRACCPTSTYD